MIFKKLKNELAVAWLEESLLSMPEALGSIPPQVINWVWSQTPAMLALVIALFS